MWSEEKNPETQTREKLRRMRHKMYRAPNSPWRSSGSRVAFAFAFGWGDLLSYETTKISIDGGNTLLSK